MEGLLTALYEALTAADADYVIIGGISASIQGEPRTTRDVNVVILLTEKQIQPLLRRFRALGFSFDMERTRRKLESGAAAKLGFPGGFSVDLRLAGYGIDKAALEERETARLFGLRLFICAPEELIVYKLARYSPLDQQDIRAILKTQGERLRRRRVLRLARELSDEIRDPRLVERWERSVRRV